MAELEAGLGARLLQRNTRGIALTDLGRRFYQHCQVVLSEAEAARLEVSSMLAEPSGRLRVSCPLGVASHQVARLIPEFLEAYPRVEQDMVMTNRRVNLLEEGIDVALRVRAEGDEGQSLATRRLTLASAYLLASTEVAKRIGPILHPRELAGEPLLGALEADQRTHLILYGPGGEKYDLNARPRFSVEEFTLRKFAALRGLGLTSLPANFCAEELKAGQLVSVLPPGWGFPPAHFHAVYPTQRGLLPAVRAFVDFLAGRISGTA